MKNIFLIFAILLSFISYSQCTGYQVYESFSSSLPTQGGTWSHTSISYTTSTSALRNGSNCLVFNAVGDIIRTPQIASPGVFSFWYKRNSTSTGSPQFTIETSPDNTNWTSRGTVTPGASYVQYTLDLGALSLTNVYVRVRDTRTSGTAERYIDDMSWTSTSSSNNTLIPAVSNCNQTIANGTTYTFTDRGGTSDTYNNSLSQSFTFSPGTVGMKVEINFSSLVGEVGTGGTLYDYISVYNGPTTASTLIGTYTSVPSNVITSTASGGELTVTFTSDVSTVNAGWVSTIYLASTPLPVVLNYFDGATYPLFNVLRWSTESEKNSDYFLIQRSSDGNEWRNIVTKKAAGNSNEKINYSYIDYYVNNGYVYYKLIQYDIDGKYNEYGPISLYYTPIGKKVVKYINSMGQEVDSSTKGIIFEVYDDGTMKKIVK